MPAAQHSTAQHSTAQHSTAQHSTAQHSTAQHSTAQHSTAEKITARHGREDHKPKPTLLMLLLLNMDGPAEKVATWCQTDSTAAAAARNLAGRNGAMNASRRTAQHAASPALLIH
jgi:hypothetical protein